MKNIILFTLASLFLTACGGGSSSGSNGSSGTSGGLSLPSGDTTMETSVEYSVSPGDMIIKTSEPTKVQISHYNGQSQSSVVLLEGSAIIRRP